MAKLIIRSIVSIIRIMAGMYEEPLLMEQPIIAAAENVHAITINDRIINLLKIISFTLYTALL